VTQQLINAVKSLKRWQIITLAIVVVGSFAVTYGSYAMAARPSQADLQANQRLVPARFGKLTKQVSVNGALTFSKKKVLTFGSTGTVEELLDERLRAAMSPPREVAMRSAAIKCFIRAPTDL